MVSINWKGEKIIGLVLNWDCEKQEVHLSMPAYVEKALHQFGHERITRWQEASYPHVPPKCGTMQQFAESSDDLPLFDKNSNRFIQQVNGKFLFWGQAVDLTLFTVPSSLASQQAKPAEETMWQARQLPYYVASQEEAIITYPR